MASGREQKPVRCRLYVAGESPNSRQALANLEAIRQQWFGAAGGFEFEVVDVLQDPGRAASDRVLVTPTLVTLSKPPRQVVGNLSDAAAVVLAIFGSDQQGVQSPARPTSPGKQIRNLIRQLSQVESDLEALIANQADAILHPELGVPILLREAQRALKRSEERYRLLAHHDSLTGLPNRLLFAIRMEHAIERARRDKTGAALFYLDVDRFKAINDTLGHRVGDEVLQEFGRRLEACLRNVDTVARVGGDEFAILVEGMERPEDARRLAVKLIGAIAEPMAAAGRTVNTSTSIGIVFLPRDAEAGEQLLQAADDAMYRAKAKGRGSYEFYSMELNLDFGVVQVLEAELAAALRQGELELHYQPEVEIATGRVVGMEALLRWRHPRRGLLLPHTFMDAAENTPLMGAVGEWVLRTACLQAAQWRREGWPVRLDVNLSARDLGHRDLVERIRSIYSELGLGARDLDLQIELSERLLPAATRNADILGSLPELGIALSVDHYGRDHAPIASLGLLPVARIKIDRQILKDMGRGTTSLALAKGLIAMGHGLGLKVGVCGVENDEQFDLLRHEHCDEGQGFLFSGPLPAHNATELLRRNTPLH